MHDSPLYAYCKIYTNDTKFCKAREHVPRFPALSLSYWTFSAYEAFMRMKGNIMEIKYFRQRELAERWRINQRTLERWRWLNMGPAYYKIGNSVLYRLSDIEDFEKQGLRQNAA